jgi:hypothetical protein
MTLHQRIVDESLKKALTYAFDAPERFGGPPQPPKKTPPKKKVPLLKRIKRGVTRVAQAAFPNPLEASVSLHSRVFTEEKKTFAGSVKRAGRTFRDYADVSDPTHPWHRLLKAAADHKGGKSQSASAPSTAKSTEKAPKQASKSSTGKGSTEGGSAAEKAFKKVRGATEKAALRHTSREQRSRNSRSTGLSAAAARRSLPASFER